MQDQKTGAVLKLAALDGYMGPFDGVQGCKWTAGMEVDFRDGAVGSFG